MTDTVWMYFIWLFLQMSAMMLVYLLVSFIDLPPLIKTIYLIR